MHYNFCRFVEGFMKRLLLASLVSAPLAFAAIITVAAAPPACDSGNGGLKLPEGFCALVVADNLGAARHAVVASNGDLYVALQGGRGGGGGVVALRDTNGDGKMDITEHIGDKST